MRGNYCLKDKITVLIMKINLPSSLPLARQPWPRSVRPRAGSAWLQSREGPGPAGLGRPTLTPSPLTGGGSGFTFREFAIEGQNNLRNNGKKPAIMYPHQTSQQNFLFVSSLPRSELYERLQAEWSLCGSGPSAPPFHVPPMPPTTSLGVQKVKAIFVLYSASSGPTHRIMMKISVRFILGFIHNR